MTVLILKDEVHISCARVAETEITLHKQCLGDIFFSIHSNTVWYKSLPNLFEISTLSQHCYQDSEEIGKKGKKSSIMGSAMRRISVTERWICWGTIKKIL